MQLATIPCHLIYFSCAFLPISIQFNDEAFLAAIAHSIEDLHLMEYIAASLAENWDDSFMLLL